MSYVEEDDNFGLRVPRHMWRMAWDGEAPAAVSPWGEAHPAMAIPVIEGATPVLYKPYTTPVGSSRGYVAWQISRAAGALYGSRLAPDEVAERFLWTDFDGKVRLKDEVLALPGEGGLAVGLSADPYLPVTLALVAVLMYAGIAIYVPSVRAGVSKTRRAVRLWIVLGVLLLWHMAPHALALARLDKPWVLEAAGADVLLRIVRAMPGGIAGVWIAAFLLGAAAFEVAVVAFKNAESPVEPDSCLWNNLDRGE